jgi:hypothetical protein
MPTAQATLVLMILLLFQILFFVRKFFNSHLFWLNSHPFFVVKKRGRPAGSKNKTCTTRVWIQPKKVWIKKIPFCYYKIKDRISCDGYLGSPLPLSCVNCTHLRSCAALLKICRLSLHHVKGMHLYLFCTCNKVRLMH